MDSEQVIATKPPHFETTWLEGIVHFESKKLPDGSVILIYVLGNGHRYAIPLKGQVLNATRQAVSPLAVASADALPNRNGHGA